jgi:adhesin/invasin
VGVTVQDANKNGVAGVTVTFDDGNKGGVLTPATVITDSAGKARTSYRLPNLPGKYFVNASSSGLKTLRFGETAVVGQPASVAIVSGDNQSTGAGTNFPQSLKVKVTDQVGNAISGAQVTFTAPSGSFTGNPATTDSSGNATVTYTAGTTAGFVTVTATAGSATAQFHETVTAGAAASIAVSGGDNQIGSAGSQLPLGLSVIVGDQYANPVSGVSVTFDDGGSGGGFVNGNPVLTDIDGAALEFYILPPSPGTFAVSASAAGVAVPASFTESGQ